MINKYLPSSDSFGPAAEKINQTTSGIDTFNQGKSFFLCSFVHIKSLSHLVPPSYCLLTSV